MSKLFWTLVHKSSSADFLNHVCLDPSKCLIILILIVCSVKIRTLTQKLILSDLSHHVTIQI